MITDRGEGDRIVAVRRARRPRRGAVRGARASSSRCASGGRSYGQCAVFYRTNAQSRPIEEELLKYDVPYVVVGGVRFYDRAEVKDVLSYLRALVNPADAAALRRIVNRPARGIGKTHARARRGDRGASAASRCSRRCACSPRASRDARGPRCGASSRWSMSLAAELLARARPPTRSRACSTAAATSRALEREGTPEAEARLENLRELLLGAEDFAAANAGESDEPERRSSTSSIRWRSSPTSIRPSCATIASRS